MKSATALPLAENFVETLKMINTFWGATALAPPGQAPAAVPGLPSLLVPTLDVAELDKRIADLRAVEQWLALNASMLRTTIQTIEVQRNTIATLKSFGSAPPTRAADAADQVQQSAPAPQPRRARKAKPAAPDAAPLDPSAWWNALQEQFTRIAAAAAGAEPKPAPRAAARKRARKGATS